MRGERVGTVANTGKVALALDESQYESGYGPCLDAAVKGESVFIDDMSIEHRYGDYQQTALKLGVHSSMGLPIPYPGDVRAALNVFATELDGFDDDSKQLAATFASYATVAMTNMHVCDNARQLAEHLQTAMRSSRGDRAGQRRPHARAALHRPGGLRPAGGCVTALEPQGARRRHRPGRVGQPAKGRLSVDQLGGYCSRASSAARWAVLAAKVLVVAPVVSGLGPAPS